MNHKIKSTTISRRYTNEDEEYLSTHKHTPRKSCKNKKATLKTRQMQRQKHASRQK